MQNGQKAILFPIQALFVSRHLRRQLTALTQKLPGLPLKGYRLARLESVAISSVLLTAWSSASRGASVHPAPLLAPHRGRLALQSRPCLGAAPGRHPEGHRLPFH